MLQMYGFFFKKTNLKLFFYKKSPSPSGEGLG